LNDSSVFSSLCFFLSLLICHPFVMIRILPVHMCLSIWFLTVSTVTRPLVFFHQLMRRTTYRYLSACRIENLIFIHYNGLVVNKL
jgi:hypothetical protein